MGTIAEQGRSKKIIVFRYKAKTRYRKKTGHRQHFTKVVVDDILMPGQEPKPKQAVEPEPVAAVEPEKKGRGRKKAGAMAPVVEATPETAAIDEVEMDAPDVDAAAETVEEKPKRGRKKAE